MAVATVPAVTCMEVAATCEFPNWRMLWVWIGLLSLMAARAAAIWASMKGVAEPFAWMSDSLPPHEPGQAQVRLPD